MTATKLRNLSEQKIVYALKYRRQSALLPPREHAAPQVGLGHQRFSWAGQGPHTTPSDPMLLRIRCGAIAVSRKACEQAGSVLMPLLQRAQLSEVVRYIDIECQPNTLDDSAAEVQLPQPLEMPLEAVRTE